MSFRSGSTVDAKCSEIVLQDAPQISNLAGIRALSVTYDPATNRQTGECADANGNLCGSYYVYDVENRLVRKGAYLDVAYSYRPGNKRVWKGTNYVYNDQTDWSMPSTDEVTFWSINGQKLATYTLSQYQPGGYYTLPQLVATQTGTNYYFGGKLVKNSTGYVTPDRLGSIGKYFPYGQERPSATQDGKEKFATYFRDSETGLDYANNRYHQPGMGRFMTVDPYSGSASANAPGSWNRYAYSGGDPVNNSDPSGLEFLSQCSQVLETEGNPVAMMSACGSYIPELYNLPGNFSDPNASVLANDLGHTGPGSGNDPLAFSGAYDLNNGAPGFGSPDPGVPPPDEQSCASRLAAGIQNNTGTSATNLQYTGTVGGHADYTFDVSDPTGFQGILNQNPAWPLPFGLDQGSRYGVIQSTHIETTVTGGFSGHTDLFNGHSFPAPLHWIVDVGIGHIPGVNLDFGCNAGS